jgi:hypothetical protein
MKMAVSRLSNGQLPVGKRSGYITYKAGYEE